MHVLGELLTAICFARQIHCSLLNLLLASAAVGVPPEPPAWLIPTEWNESFVAALDTASPVGWAPVTPPPRVGSCLELGPQDVVAQKILSHGHSGDPTRKAKLLEKWGRLVSHEGSTPLQGWEFGRC